MRKPYLIIAGFTGAFLYLASCSRLLPPEPEAEDILGAPLDGLTEQQLSTHLAGDMAFAKNFAVADGLGPIYVATSCEGCHIGDGKGHPLTALTRFNSFDGTTYNPMHSAGGPQLQHRSIAGYEAETIPAGATGSSVFLSPAVSGLGFLSLVSDADILALADSADANGDGISGVPNWVAPTPFFQPQPWHISNNGRYIGRFGRKAAAIDLLQQTSGAYLNDMGITSDYLMQDVCNMQVGPNTGDNVADPEVRASTVNNVVFYMTTLKAPPRRNTSDPDVLAGETIFSQVGCASCHRPSLQTGFSVIAPLSNKTFFPYTDLLLHDMGPQLDDGYSEGSAASAEWRTTPLWGVGLGADSQGGSMFLMHDGRAHSYDEAINLHGGEGTASRSAYQGLSQNEKDQLIKFLESL
jgi:CxxC motif-containing protein (DUF1111 family)